MGVRRIRGILHQGGGEADFFHVGEAQKAHKEHASSDDKEWVTDVGERYGLIAVIAKELGETPYAIQSIINVHLAHIPTMKRNKGTLYQLSAIEKFLSAEKPVFDENNFLVREDGKYGTAGGIADYLRIGATKLRLRIAEAVVRTIEAKSVQ